MGNGNIRKMEKQEHKINELSFRLNSLQQKLKNQFVDDDWLNESDLDTIDPGCDTTRSNVSVSK